MRRRGRQGLTVVLILVFLIMSVVPEAALGAPSTSPRRPGTQLQSTSSGGGAPPQAVPEDPLGQQSEQAMPEISIDVDVRDGHLTARVVDIWGPGRAPLVMRSYTNAQPMERTTAYASLGPTPPNSGPYRFHFNHLLDVIGTSVLESDGNRSPFRFVREWWSSDNLHYYQLYVKDVGTYATMVLHYNCTEPIDLPPRDSIQSGSTTAGTRQSPQAPSGMRITTNTQSAPSNCSWDGWHTIYLAKGTVRRFAGNLIADHRDANGNVTTFAYTTFSDGIGSYLTSVTDPVGRKTTYAYEHAYQLCSQKGGIENAGECVEYKWVYRLRTATDPYGRAATYSYDGNSLKITAVTNAAGGITRYTYNSSALLASVTNARGVTTTIEWTSGPDGTPRVARVLAPNGETTAYAYTHESTSPYRVIRTVVTNARSHATTYDISNGDVAKATDPLGNVTQYAYDSRHNVTQVTDPLGHVTSFTYNGHNKVTQIVQASGTLNLTTTLSWDSAAETPIDNLLNVTNPRGIRTDYTYDSKHNLTGVRRAVGTADEMLTQYTYTSWGGVASVVDPRGNTTTFAYTARRQIQTVTPPAGGATAYGYSTVDDQVTMTNGNGRTWTTVYSVARLATSVTDPLNNVIRHEYDANGNRTRTYDPKNQATTFAYDNRDRLTSITDPLNGVTRYEYDPVNNLTRIINARNHATAFLYDVANRLTQVTDALGQATTYTYDAAGNRVSMRDRKGTTHTYTYDQVNRLTQVSAGGLTVSYVYDANGNRTTLTDGGGTTTFTYDNLDRLTRKTTPDGRSIRYAYDRAGNRTQLTYPDGTTGMTYGYDAANRLTQMTVGTLSWGVAYDAAGNRTALTQPNGTRTDYAYLANNWLSSLTHKRPDGSVFQSFAYTYDANGNRITQADPTGTTTFTYDAVNRLTGAAYPGTYGSWSWAYDAVGNRTSQTAPSGTTPYTYDANNRLIQAGAVTYSYDANGNLTSTSAGQSFSWDVFNRMTAASSPGGSVSYTHNGDGLKVRRTGPDGATVYYYDGIWPIWEADSAGAPRVQLDRDIFGNLLSRREVNGTRRYFGHDGLGGLTAATDETGVHLSSLFYDAWGNLRANSGTWSEGYYRFIGAELDPSTGLYHMGARFYDSSLGRWLSEDPVQSPFEPLSLNFYAYVANNPLVLSDSTGMMPTACDGGCGGTTTIAPKIDAQREALEQLANMIGIPVDRVLPWLNEQYAWLQANIDTVLAFAADALGWVGVVLAAASIGIVAGLIAGNAAAVIGTGALAVAGLSVVVAVVRASRGQISWQQAGTTTGKSALSMLPAFRAGTVARIVANWKGNLAQAGQIWVWHKLWTYSIVAPWLSR
jgi:RHS repeat-associated protein